MGNRTLARARQARAAGWQRTERLVAALQTWSSSSIAIVMPYTLSAADVGHSHGLRQRVLGVCRDRREIVFPRFVSEWPALFTDPKKDETHARFSMCDFTQALLFDFKID